MCAQEFKREAKADHAVVHEHQARVYESERIGALAWTQQYDAEVGGHYFLNTATVTVPESATPAEASAWSGGSAA